MPPTLGMAIGCITSEPRPLSRKIGASSRIVVTDDEGPQWNAVNRSRRVQRLDEPLPRPILRPPRPATVAEEREQAGLTVVVVLHLFARRWIGVHRQGKPFLQATK